MDFGSTIICAASGATATAAAAAAGETVLFWVGIGITAATTIYNFIRDARIKWHEDTEKIKNKKGDK